MRVKNYILLLIKQMKILLLIMLFDFKLVRIREQVRNDFNEATKQQIQNWLPNTTVHF